MDIPETEPIEITAGDTIKWKRTDMSSDYPASSWTLKYSFRGSVSSDIVAAADGVNYAITIASTITAIWPAGDYSWDAYVSKSGERYKVASGILKVNTNLESISGQYDGRSHAKKMLDAIEATIEGRATKEHQEVEINGRRLSLLSPEVLIKFHSFYKSQYQVELRNAALRQKLGNNIRTNTRKILTKFT